MAKRALVEKNDEIAALKAAYARSLRDMQLGHAKVRYFSRADSLPHPLARTLHVLRLGFGCSLPHLFRQPPRSCSLSRSAHSVAFPCICACVYPSCFCKAHESLALGVRRKCKQYTQPSRASRQLSCPHSWSLARAGWPVRGKRPAILGCSATSLAARICLLLSSWLRCVSGRGLGGGGGVIV